MTRITLGFVCGVAFGLIGVGLMLPLSFPHKTIALGGAFAGRFAIGSVIACLPIPEWPGWIAGLLFGLLISLPDAIVTNYYTLMLMTGAVCGAVIGGLIHGWKSPT